MVTKPRSRALSLAAGAAAFALLAGCSGGGQPENGGTETNGGESTETEQQPTTGESINVLMINAPQFAELQQLTEQHFTPETGIQVNFTALPENDLRDRVSQEFAAQAGEFDVASVSAYDAPIFAANGWLEPLGARAEGDADFNVEDIFDSIRALLSGADGDLYATPFFAEGSLLMYRTDILAEAGITMPDNPTWDEVAAAARTIQEGDYGVSGICMRGLAGWGQVLAPFNTLVNTFGAQYVDMDWNPQLDSPEWAEVTDFYASLLQDAGPEGSAQNGVLECINLSVQGETAMVYDASSIAAQLEADDSPTQGNWGFAQAPVKSTDASSWLWTWAWGIQAASTKTDAAWEFISWASSEAYEEAAAAEFGWQKVPAGKRASLYEKPEYQEAAASFYAQELEAIENADPDHPGVNPQPFKGAQFIGIPEFQDFGTLVSQEISAVIAGTKSVEDALAASQQYVFDGTSRYRD